MYTLLNFTFIAKLNQKTAYGFFNCSKLQNGGVIESQSLLPYCEQVAMTCPTYIILPIWWFNFNSTVKTAMNTSFFKSEF